jgi:hypothetical protein
MDLFVLAADKNVEYAIKGGLTRPQALGTRPFTFDTKVHVGRDGGARSSGVDMLALERDKYYATVLIFDFEGCGTDKNSALELEMELDQNLLAKVGPRSKAIVINPEADIWMWGGDNILAEILKWRGPGGIREWLGQRGFAFDDNGKPVRPKEAMDKVAAECRTPRSSALYQRIATRLSLQNCIDPAFIRLRDKLVQWFPIDIDG